MYSDRTPTPLPAEASELLHQLWERLARSGIGDVERDELRRIARAVSDAAHRASLLPEQLIVAVKDSWGTHPVLLQPEERQEAQWVLTQVVTLCIHEFYRGAPPRARKDGDGARIATPATPTAPFRARQPHEPGAEA